MIRYLLLLSTMLCSSSQASAETALGRVMKHVPENTALVVLTPDLGLLESGLISFGKAATIDDLGTLKPGELLDEVFSADLEGIDSDGPFVVAMSPGMKTPLLLCLLEKNAKWQPASGQTPQGSPYNPRWLKGQVGNVGILAKDQLTLEAAIGADGRFLPRFKAVGKKTISENHVVAWADVAAWKPIISPAVTMAEGFLQMTMAISDPQAEGNAAIWRWIFEKTRLVLNESETYVAGINVSRRGILASDVLVVSSTGELADWLKIVQPAGLDPLRGLWGEPGMIAFGTECRMPGDAKTLSEEMLDAILQTTAGEQLMQDPDFVAGIDAAKKLYRRVSGYNGTMESSTEGRMTANGLYLTDRPMLALKDIHASFETAMSRELMATFSSHLTLETEHATADSQGTEYDVYRLSFKTENEEMRRAMLAVYGEKTEFCLSPHEHGVVYSMGPEGHCAKTMQHLLSGDEARLSTHPQTIKARKSIDPDPQLVVLLDLPKLVQFGMNLWKSLAGSGPTLELPGERPLVAFGIYLHPRSMRSELFVPAISIRQAVAMVNDAEQQIRTGS